MTKIIAKDDNNFSNNLQGEIPDKNRFKEQIAQAKQNRITENQNFDSQFFSFRRIFHARFDNIVL